MLGGGGGGGVILSSKEFIYLEMQYICLHLYHFVYGWKCKNY